MKRLHEISDAVVFDPNKVFNNEYNGVYEYSFVERLINSDYILFVFDNAYNKLFKTRETVASDYINLNYLWAVYEDSGTIETCTQLSFSFSKQVSGLYELVITVMEI